MSSPSKSERVDPVVQQENTTISADINDTQPPSNDSIPKDTIDEDDEGGNDEDEDDDEPIDPASLTEENLINLLAAGSVSYTKKQYGDAVDFYSSAAQIQTAMYGEMVPSNGEVIFLYGQALFKLAVESSDVLGGKGAQKALVGGGLDNEDDDKGKKRIEHLTEPIRQDKGKDTVKPGFEFADDDQEDGDGDAEGDEEDGEDEDGEGNGESDDFADAYEMLDLARILFNRGLEAVQTDPTAASTNIGPNVAFEMATKSSSYDPKPTTDSDPQTARLLLFIKTRLAAIHDYQAEILLESERFRDAVVEFETVVSLRDELEPEESNLVAEGRYKLALAMEFASLDGIRKAQQEKEQNQEQGQTNGESKQDDSQDGVESGKVDTDLRARAVVMMESAIRSCRLRVEIETKKASDLEPESTKRVELEKEIEDVKDMIGEMESRIIDLKVPVKLDQANGSQSSTGLDPSSGLPPGFDLDTVLGAMMGGTSAFPVGGIGGKKGKEQAESARDISGLIKTKRKRDDEQVEDVDLKRVRTSEERGE